MTSQLLSLLRQKRFLQETVNNDLSYSIAIKIDKLLTEYISTIVWEKDHDSVINLIFFLNEDNKKNPCFIHNESFLRSVLYQKDVLIETLNNPLLTNIKDEMKDFILNWYRSEKDGNDVLF